MKDFLARGIVNAKLDNTKVKEAKNLLVILSTARSGSTLLCEHLFQSGSCLAGEYFHPKTMKNEYAKRWSALKKNGAVDLEKYCRKLEEMRTLDNGWLGIKVHATHIPVLTKALQHLGHLNVSYAYISRQNRIKQAISYYIASSTGKWSHRHKTVGTVRYSYRKILSSLKTIQADEDRVARYIRSMRLSPVLIKYEDLVADPLAELIKLPCYDSALALKDISLKKQADHRNEDMLAKFNEEYQTKHNNTVPLLNQVRKLFRLES
jgi:LPS sulfotransferase NodH